MFNDVIFLKNHFWIDVSNFGIYYKALDQQIAKRFCEGDKNSASFPGRVLKPILGDKCIVSMKYPTLSFFKIENDFTAGDVKVVECLGHRNVDFEVFEYDKVLLITSDCILSFLQIRLELGKITVENLDKVRVDGIGGRVEESSSLTVCLKGNFFLVNLGDYLSYSTSLLVYKIERRKLVKQVTLDITKKNFKVFSCLGFMGKEEGRFVFTGAPLGSYKFLSFEYDSRNLFLKEVENLRKNVYVGPVYKLVELRRGELRGISNTSELIQIKY